MANGLLRLSGVGYVLTLALGFRASAGFRAVGWVQQPRLAIALSVTSLGLVLKNAGSIDSEVGQTAIAAATVADFAMGVLLWLFFSASAGSTGSSCSSRSSHGWRQPG